MAGKIKISSFARSGVAYMLLMPFAISQAGLAQTAGLTQSVVQALERAGVVVSPEQIVFLAGVRSSLNAGVRVVSVTDAGDGSVKVKLRCRDNRECLPFYVLVQGIQGGDMNTAKIAAVPAGASGPLSAVVRGGDRAILTLERADSRMRFPVICLQSGVRGQTIRAASPDHKNFYDAEVVAAGMLKGSF